MSKWKKTKLKNIVKFSSGEFLPSSKQKNGGIPVYGGNGITGWHDESIIDYSTVVIGRVGAYCGSIHLTNRKSWITDNAIFIKKILDELDIEYLFRYLSRLKINLLAEVSAQPKISQGILNSLSVQYPENKIEQQKIVSILSNVDSLIESYDKTIVSTKKLKTGLMQTLLTKGIGHKKFKKMTLFPRYNEETIPENWDVKTAEKLIKIIDYRGRTPPFAAAGIIHLRSNNIRDGKINFNEITYVTEDTYAEFMTRGIPQENDILFTTEGPLGEVALVPKDFKFSLAQRIIVLRPKTKEIDSYFLKFLLQNKIVKNRYEGLSTGTTLGGIASKWFTKLFLPFPTNIKEQEFIGKTLFSLENKINNLESKKRSLEKIKNGLMQKLLTGQIRVRI